MSNSSILIHSRVCKKAVSFNLSWSCMVGITLVQSCLVEWPVSFSSFFELVLLNVGEEVRETCRRRRGVWRDEKKHVVERKKEKTLD